MRRLIALLLPLLAAPLPAADPLAQAAAALRRHPAWRAEFVQTWIPAGFENGTEERGELLLAPPDRLRFDYAGASPRVFAVDGAVARMVDPQAASCEAVRLDDGAWGRLPLAAVLDPAAARRAFAVAPIPGGVELRPHEPLPDVVRILLLLGPDSLPARVEVEDDSGNLNRFRFLGWAEAPPPAATRFRPALPGAPPCHPEQP
jgi:hypothetical protein